MGSDMNRGCFVPTSAYQRRLEFIERNPTYDRDRKRRYRAAIKAAVEARAAAVARQLALPAKPQPLALPAAPVRLALPAPEPMQLPLFILADQRELVGAREDGRMAG